MSALVVRGGRVIDPARAIDQVADIAFVDGRAAEPDAEPPAGTEAESFDATGLLVVPGLIDLHTHVYWGGTALGVDAGALARRGGTLTFVDAGSAGPGNFAGFRAHVIAPSPVRILAYLNISFAGIFAFSRRVMVGECADLRLLDMVSCREVAAAHRDLIVGIKVRVGRAAGGASGLAPLDMAIEVAEALDLPVMAHIDQPPPSRRAVTERLRPGDILTHCFRPFPNAPVGPGDAVRADVLAARARGVVFDIGHGAGSFGFDTARTMIAAGFLPDVISSDVHALSIDGPAFDLLETLSKFHCLGVDLPALIRAATAAPAAALRRPDLGTLDPAGVGDATLLELVEGDFSYVDVDGATLPGRTRLVCRGLIKAGRWLQRPDASE
ncbi:MAG: amidohydrolase/deacetylase family metallohydrolase [Alphaproteobacteria bacterium]